MRHWKNKNPEVYDALLESIENYVADYYVFCSHSCAATYAWQSASDSMLSSLPEYAWDIVNAARDCNLELFQVAVHEVESTIGYDDLDSQIKEVSKHIIRHLIKERIDAHANR